MVIGFDNIRDQIGRDVAGSGRPNVDPSAPPGPSLLPGPGEREGGGGARRTAPKPPPKPTPRGFDVGEPAGASSSSSGGGSGGGGGGSGYASISPSLVSAASADNSWEGAIERARQSAQRAREALDGQYEEARAELRDQYRFSETDEEREQIAGRLGQLREERELGVLAIDRGYEGARENVLQRETEIRGRATADAAAVGDVYRSGMGAMNDLAHVADGRAEGGGLGVGADGGTSATDGMQAMMAAAAPREQALTQRLGDVAADDMGWLAETLQGEQHAQGAELGRLVTGLQHEAQQEHSRRVADRIQQERMMWADQLGGLQGDFRTRGFQLDDTDVDLLAQLGQMQQTSAEAAADRQQQAAMANASARQSAAAANARGSAGSGGGGDGMPAPGTLEGDLFALDLVDKYGPGADGVLSEHGYGTPSGGGGGSSKPKSPFGNMTVPGLQTMFQ